MKAVMNEAELYQRSNNLQKTDAIKCLKEYAFKIKWRNSRIQPRILDIGCGDGSVTADVLKPHIPLESRLDGCDISEKMVNFANAHYKDETTSFSVMDIAGELPEELIEAYDHVFSFYTVHWIRHQKRAFENIYRLLVPGGDCLLLFLGWMPMFDVYRIMAETSKWGRRLSDVEEYVPRYHDSQEPEKEIKDMMEEVGFRDIDVQCKNSVMYYDKIELLKNAVMAVNPFSIPRHLHDDFMEDYLDVVRDLRMTDDANNNLSDGLNIKASYSLIVVYAGK